MYKFLLPIAALAVIMLPAAANAEQCRDSASGKFAKCGAPGAVLASNYVAKGKPKKASHAMAPMTATTTPAKPGLMAMFKPKPKPMAQPAMAQPAMTKPTMAGPMMAKPMKSKAVRCKTPKGKFVKCGTAGAAPA